MVLAMFGDGCGIDGLRVQHDCARAPHDCQNSHCGGDRAPSDVSAESRIFTHESTNPPLEHVRAAETDPNGDRTRWPFGDGQYCGRKGNVAGARRGGVVREDLRLIGEILRETPHCREPEQRRGQRAKQEQAQRIPPKQMRVLVRDHGDQFLVLEVLGEMPRNVDTRPDKPCRERWVGKTSHHDNAPLRYTDLTGSPTHG